MTTDTAAPDGVSITSLNAASSKFFEGTKEAGEILHSIYPKHLYAPLRRRMAVELSGKEIAKILDAESNKHLMNIRHAVTAMYDGRDDVYSPVHDFWSFVEMVLHIKKKELPELITAANVDWSVKDVPIDELYMSWMPFLEQNEDIFGKKPWSIKQLRQKFSQSADLLEEAKEDQREIVGLQQHKFEQSDEPITVLDRGQGYEMIDGNGRLYRALLNGKDTLTCYIGHMSGDVPIDYWVSAGSLKQFCLEVRGFSKSDPEAYSNGVNYLKTKLKSNQIARINYELYLRDDFKEFNDDLAGILSES